MVLGGSTVTLWFFCGVWQSSKLTDYSSCDVLEAQPSCNDVYQSLKIIHYGSKFSRSLSHSALLGKLMLHSFGSVSCVVCQQFCLCSAWSTPSSTIPACHCKEQITILICQLEHIQDWHFVLPRDAIITIHLTCWDFISYLCSGQLHSKEAC